MKRKISKISWIILFLLLIFILADNIINQIKNGNEDSNDNELENAPNFTLQTIEGNEIELEDLRGKGVLVNFWASWCKPCQEEMPAIQRIYDTYKDKGLEVLAINIGETEVKIKKFLEGNSTYTFPFLLEDNDIESDYMVKAIPTTFFVKPDGNIEKRHMGELDEEQLEVLTRSILPSNQ